MSTKITVKSLGLVVGSAAIAAAAALTVSMSHDGGASSGTVNIAKVNLTTGNSAYTTPSAKVGAGGSDSTTAANSH